MIKFFANDDFIVYNERGNVILTGVNTGVNNIYSITKPFPLSGDDLECAKRIVEEHFSTFLSAYTDNEIYVKMNNGFWRSCGLVNAHISVDKVLQIIDDGLCHGFEFKVQNGTIYYREIMNNL